MAVEHKEEVCEACGCLAEVGTIIHEGDDVVVIPAEYWKVFIDWNGDGDFADVNETTFAGSTTNLQTGDNTTSITVPSDAVSGSFRMRVSMKFNVFSTSCETITEGEVEDYTINVAGGSATTLTQGSDVLLSTLTIDSDGTFSQGATYSLTTGGILSVGSGGAFSNIGTGDLVLGGNVSNAGTMILNSNNSAQCTDSANDIAITSTVGGTQRTWSGVGTFTLYNLAVTDMTDSSITAYNSTLTNTTWTVGGGCESVSSGGGGVSVEHGDGGGTAQTGGTNPGGGTTSSGSSGDGSTNLAGQVSSGPRSPGTVGEDTSVGNRSWNNATNVLVSDGAYGYMSGGGLPQGYYLKLTNFGFNIPIDATISGIKVESELYSTNPNDHDASIKLVAVISNF
jgi:hypothetical protein